MANESHVAYTCICIAGIPDLIRLANDLETNPDLAVVDNTDSSKTICAQMYLAVLEMANSFRKLWLTAEANHVA